MGTFYMYDIGNLELGSRVAMRVAILAFWSNIKIDL